MNSEHVLARGVIENIGGSHSFLKHYPGKEQPVELDLPAVDHAAGLGEVLKILVHPQYGIIADYPKIAAVGHRVVHAGEEFSSPVLVNDRVIEALTRCSELAPLHNPANIMGIEACRQLMPGTPQAAVFDNAFHGDLPDYAYIYGLPYHYYQKYGVRKYGFHGISFSYMTDRAARIVGADLNKLRVVSLMLGSGCTANAFAFGRSVDVSTGFTPNEGLIQSTRAGDVDAAVITYIMRKEGLTPNEMDDIIYRESGWKGISGIGNDFRQIEQAALAGNWRAKLAINALVHRVKKCIGAYAAVMEGIDLLVFAGGVGEKSRMLRSEVCRGLDFLGIKLNLEANEKLQGEGIISDQSAVVPVVVVNTNEELVIARETFKLV
jgi:acetate kinase